jgi:hypothetical protein
MIRFQNRCPTFLQNDRGMIFWYTLLKSQWVTGELSWEPEALKIAIRELKIENWCSKQRVIVFL